MLDSLKAWLIGRAVDLRPHEEVTNHWGVFRDGEKVILYFSAPWYGFDIQHLSRRWHRRYWWKRLA